MTEHSTEKKKIVPFSDSSLAYELRDFEERHMKRGRQPVTKTRRRAVQQERTLALPRVSLFAGLVFVTLMAMLLMVVYSYMNLNEIITANSRMRIEISRLETEKAKLNTAIEQRMSLNELEERAMALGMVKPEGEQIHWFDLSGEDHAVVVENQKGWLAQIGDALSNAFGTILE